MTRFVLVLGVVASVVVAVLLWQNEVSVHTESMEVRRISIGDTQLSVVIADTDEKRSLGLGGRDVIPEDGMLFMFEQEGRYSFWMKGMRMPLDIIWIAADGTVAHIARSVPPESYPQSFMPPTPVRYVLEVAAGFATEHGIEVGSKVIF